MSTNAIGIRTSVEISRGFFDDMVFGGVGELIQFRVRFTGRSSRPSRASGEGTGEVAPTCPLVDASGRCASNQATLRALLRAVRWPRACIRSMWDKRHAEGSSGEIRRLYPARSARKTFRTVRIDAVPRPEVRETGVQSFAPRIEYDPPLGIQRLQLEPHGFTHSSPDAVAYHRLAKSARRRESDFRGGSVVRAGADGSCQNEGGEKRARVARPFVVSFAEVA